MGPVADGRESVDRSARSRRRERRSPPVECARRGRGGTGRRAGFRFPWAKPVQVRFLSPALRWSVEGGRGSGVPDRTDAAHSFGDRQASLHTRARAGRTRALRSADRAMPGPCPRSGVGRQRAARSGPPSCGRAPSHATHRAGPSGAEFVTAARAPAALGRTPPRGAIGDPEGPRRFFQFPLRSTGTLRRRWAKGRSFGPPAQSLRRSRAAMASRRITRRGACRRGPRCSRWVRCMWPQCVGPSSLGPSAWVPVRLASLLRASAHAGRGPAGFDGPGLGGGWSSAMSMRT